MICRHCANETLIPFVDLGSAPPSNSYLTSQELSGIEKWFPLRVFTCNKCWLVQTEDFANRDEFFNEEYAYFSSFSSSWLEHSKRYVSQCIEKFLLGPSSNVVEIAANDGYMLQYFQEAGIPCLGVEPTRSTAEAARLKGIEIIEEFFGVELGEALAKQGFSADLIAANNVLAHVPDMHDFVCGFTKLLKPDGVATFEFPHLLNLVRLNQFDTIYHEHFSYLSLTSVTFVFETAGLSIFDVEKLDTHGGSLRIYAQRSDSGKRKVSSRLKELELEEADSGMKSLEFYSGFQSASERVKDDFLQFLLKAKSEGKTVCGYGAAAKGNTLLNFAGIKSDLMAFVVDKNPAKQGNFMPGSRIPIVGPEVLEKNRPDYIVILPWNIASEITKELYKTIYWGARFVVAIPRLTVLEG